MDWVQNKYEKIDIAITNWLARHSILVLRISLGIVFFWFGILKLFPGLSPAQDLAGNTMEKLSFGLVHPNISIPLLATWEVLIGIGLMTGWQMRWVLLLLIVQMAGTITPIFLFPSEVFSKIPYAPTLEGQYIIKNLVLIAGAMVIGSTVRKSGASVL